MRTIPHTQGEPHFIDKGIKSVNGGGRGFVLRCLLRVSKPYFILPPSRHPIGFFASLGGCEFVRRVPSRTFENLLPVRLPSDTGFELE